MPKHPPPIDQLSGNKIHSKIHSTRNAIIDILCNKREVEVKPLRGLTRSQPLGLTKGDTLTVVLRLKSGFNAGEKHGHLL